MKKAKVIKRAIASAVSAAALLSCTAVGTYSPTVINAAGSANYAEALELSLYFYDANQCGKNVDANPLTWRGNCHTYDAEASLNSAVGLSAASKSAIMAQNGGSDKVDVSGGYHDAGDHIKFSMTMGFSATSLAWSYFTYPQAYKETGCEAHLMDILKEMCDYFMKVTYLDNNGKVIAFCYQVASEGEDHNVWTVPETQTMNRTTYWADSSHPSGDASGQMASALAACSLAFRDKDSSYADECLKYANALSDFTKQYTAATYDGIGSMYGSGSQNDDKAWADLWCALANNNGTLPSSYTPMYQWNGSSYGGEYDGWLYSWDKVWSGYAALLAEVGYQKDTYIGAVKSALNSRGGLSTSKYNADGWGASRYNCALQNSALHIAAATNDTSYQEAAKYQMDFILGNNSSGKSFLLGYGTSWPTKIHHRAANPGSNSSTDNSDAKYTPYGCLVGGPDSSGNYEDNKNSFSCTEPALDYNGCFALAIAGLYSIYGGDVNAADQLAASVPEIDANHQFGTWYQSGPQPTEPPTEAPTEAPTESPTEAPTEAPTNAPTDAPTDIPTNVPTSTPPITDVMFGDVTLDNTVHADDVVALNSYLIDSALKNLSSQAILNADCVYDNSINSDDSNAILQYVAEVIPYSNLGKQ